jgi:8-oxo-dGTP pyrophosphatase MutT (NUDIX family)
MTGKNPWVTLSTRIVHSNPWFQLRKDRVIRPDGKRGEYHTVLAPVAVGVVPCFDDGSILLVGQYRYSISRYSWEIPEGGGHPGERPIQTARRELQEETGYRAATFRSLGILHTSNCFTNEKAYLFYALNLTPGSPRQDGTEQIVSRRIPFEEALRMAVDGRITDAISIVAILRLKERAKFSSGNRTAAKA